MGDSLDAAAARAWLGGYAAAFRAARVELDELDRRGGDGDFGSNLLRAVDTIESGLAGAEAASAAQVFGIASLAFMHAGGTSGPLFGVWFRAFARAGDDAGLIDRAALARAAASGLEGVVALGRAEPGDKTMVDAMSPAAAALARAASAAGDLGGDLGAAAAAARTAADETAQLVARRGRASYVGEASRGVRDAGAEAVALFFEAGAAALRNPGSLDDSV